MSRLKVYCYSLAGAALALALAVPAHASTITYQNLGTAAPPATLGGQSMFAFPLDGRTVGNTVTDVPSPGGGLVSFSQGMQLDQIGDGWASWSNGYSGSVYYDNGSDNGGLTMTLPAGTTAFYFYAEPNVYSTYNFTALATDGSIITSSGPQAINGSGGAVGFGFYTPDTTLTSVDFSGSTGDYAVGEFGIVSPSPVPEPASLLLFGTGLVGVARGWRMRVKKV